MQTVVSGRQTSGGFVGTFREHFARNLAVALRRLGLKNQKQEAKALSVSEATLSGWLSGDKAPRHDETWARICKILNIEYEDLVRDPEKPVRLPGNVEDPFLTLLKREAEAKGYQLVKAKRRPAD